MIQFATAVSSWLGARTRQHTFSLAQLVSFGAAAAVAAAYQAPFAAVFFASEIVLGAWQWRNALPLLLASITGCLVSRIILTPGPLFPVTQAVHLTWAALWCIPLALVLGTLAPLYHSLLSLATIAKRLPGALLWGAAAVGALSVFEPRVWGNAGTALTGILHPSMAFPAALLLLAFRLTATTLCVGSGTVGGVFTPTLFTGAALGLLLSHLCGTPNAILLAVCGMAFFLSAVTHAPLMSSFMAVELTGQWWLLPVILPCAWLACSVASRLSPTSLYGVASPEPADEAPPAPSLEPLRDAGLLVSEEAFGEALREASVRRRLLRALVTQDGWEWEDVYRAPEHGVNDPDA